MRRIANRAPWAAVLVLAACSDAAVVSRPAYLAPSADVVDFGDVTVGEARQRTVYLINKGDMPLTVSATEGELGEAFSVLLDSNRAERDGQVVLRIVFAPLAAEEYTAVVTVLNDSANAPELAIRLRGQGLHGDPCRNKACDTPPARTCLTSTTSRSWNPAGTCVEGKCEYEPVDETCAQWGCDLATGACKGDPCVGRSCQQPPSTCFLANGTCRNGACEYELAGDIECDDGNPCTLGDRCAQGTCRGASKVCEQQRAPECVGGTLRRWESAGTCDANGTCQFAHTDIPCEYGCSNGACNGDPCAGGCDDHNPCTTDTCVRPAGCQHAASNGAACTSSSSECPTGRCQGTACVPVPDVTCVATYDMDLCQEAEIAGVCSASGECVVRQAPPEFQCPGCAGLCLQCYFVRLCIPL